MLGLQTQSKGWGGERGGVGDDKGEAEKWRGRVRVQDEVMALMHVLILCVTLGLKKGRRMFQ